MKKQKDFIIDGPMVFTSVPGYLQMDQEDRCILWSCLTREQKEW